MIPEGHIRLIVQHSVKPYQDPPCVRIRPQASDTESVAEVAAISASYKFYNTFRSALPYTFASLYLRNNKLLRKQIHPVKPSLVKRPLQSLIPGISAVSAFTRRFAISAACPGVSNCVPSPECIHSAGPSTAYRLHINITGTVFCGDAPARPSSIAQGDKLEQRSRVHRPGQKRRRVCPHDAPDRLRLVQRGGGRPDQRARGTIQEQSDDLQSTRQPTGV